MTNRWLLALAFSAIAATGTACADAPGELQRGGRQASTSRGGTTDDGTADETESKTAAPGGATSTPPSTQGSDSARGFFGGTQQSNGQTGMLRFSVDTPTNPAFAKYVTPVAHSAWLTNTAAMFNDALTLPNDLPVKVTECNQVNAFYDPDTHSISLCYELIDAIHQSYSSTAASDTAAQQFEITAKAMSFVFLHEAGHAFIHENNLGSLGGEEDVVDDISGVFFISHNLSDVPYLGTMALVSLGQDSDVAAYADEHSFSSQRYFNMICLIYGNDPDGHADLVGSADQWLLPPDRAARCPGEWADKQKGLAQLTAPFVRSGS